MKRVDATGSAGALIAAFVSRPKLSLDAAVMKACSRSFADTYAVAIGGTSEHASAAALQYLVNAGLLAAPQARHTSRLWGTGKRAAPEIAAWWNGIAGHVLDYDDVTVPLRGHPSVVIWPAIVALAEARNLSGDRLVEAFTVGIEVLCKLARAIASDQYAAGWHTTASLGALGGTAACAYLLGLTSVQTLNAIGLAVAQIAGSRENVGTEAKSFQAGHACAVAVRATSLAEAGFTSGPNALDGPLGYLNLYAAGEELGTFLNGLGQHPLEIHRAGIDVKQYPMCYATHRALDAVLALRHGHGLRLSDIRRVSVTASPGALVPLVHPRPSCGLEGKFSMQYAMAAALADGCIRLTSFTDAAVQRPDIQAFFDRVDVREADGPTMPRWAEVVLELADGRRLTNRVDVQAGSNQKPLDDAQFASKIEDCLRWGNRVGDGAVVLACCRAMPSQSVHALLDRLETLARLVAH